MTLRLPLAYLLFYKKVRRRFKRKLDIPKKDFYKMLSEPVGIQRKHFKGMLFDLKRYRLIRTVNGKTVRLISMAENATLFENYQELHNAGLL